MSIFDEVACGTRAVGATARTGAEVGGIEKNQVARMPAPEMTAVDFQSMLDAHQGGGPSVLDRRAADVMTRNPVTVTRTAFAVEALRLMEERKITSIVVIGAGQEVEGIVHLHDLWRTQLF